MTVKTPKTLCVIPCYNEAYNIPSLLADLSKSALLTHMDIVFVNDASTDNTAVLLEESGYLYVTHRKNLGYGGAVKTGYLLAKERGYCAMILFPGDHQRQASDAIKLNQMLFDKDFDIVVGSKFHIYSERYGPIGRRIGNRIFSNIARIFWKSPIQDVLSGFKIYRLSVVEDFFLGLPEGYPFDIVFSIYASVRNCKFAETPVACRYDEHTTKMNSVILISIKMLFFALYHGTRVLVVGPRIKSGANEVGESSQRILSNNRTVKG